MQAVFVTALVAALGCSPPAGPDAGRRVARQGKAPAASEAEQALLIHLRLSDSGFGSREDFARGTALESELEAQIARAGVGELDGNEVGGGEYVIYTYGPSASELFRVAETVLSQEPWPLGGAAVMRFGPPGSREERVEFRPAGSTN